MTNYITRIEEELTYTIIHFENRNGDKNYISIWEDGEIGVILEDINNDLIPKQVVDEMLAVIAKVQGREE